MVVTKIEALTKIKYKIDIDGQFAFVLYKGELSCYGVAEEEEISQEIVEKIRTEIVLKRAKRRALHLLEDMDRTEEELSRKLIQGMYPGDIVEKVLEYVKSFGYLNDLRYAEQFILSRKDKKSRKEIYALLTQKGIDREKIDQAFVTSYEEEAEKEAILAVFRKKRIDPRKMDEIQMHKIYAYLARKGFRYEAVRQVIQNCNDNA